MLLHVPAVVEELAVVRGRVDSVVFIRLALGYGLIGLALPKTRVTTVEVQVPVVVCRQGRAALLNDVAAVQPFGGGSNAHRRVRRVCNPAGAGVHRTRSQGRSAVADFPIKGAYGGAEVVVVRRCSGCPDALLIRHAITRWNRGGSVAARARVAASAACRD